MQNILDYFNEFLTLIFGSSRGTPVVQLLPPGTFRTYLSGIFYNSSSGDLWTFISRFFQSDEWLSILFSAFVWTWFGILIFKLLLVYPYRWLRSVIKKCRGC